MNKNNCRSGQCSLNVGKCNGTIEVGKPLRTEQSTAPEWRPVGHAGTCSAAACPREDGGAEATSGFSQWKRKSLAFSNSYGLGARRTSPCIQFASIPRLFFCSRQTPRSSIVLSYIMWYSYIPTSSLSPMKAFPETFFETRGQISPQRVYGLSVWALYLHNVATVYIKIALTH